MRTNILLYFTFSFLLLSLKSLAQVPVLGSVSNFAIFTTNGAVTNTGFSYITGDVGTNNGACTGFGNVNGVMHNADDSTAAAAADLTILYNQLNAAIPTFFPSALLGNGDTIYAGVNEIPGTSSLNDTLYLDAQGIPNALFIFKIQGAFSTNSFSQVVLIGGALACNVFWKVEGLVSLAGGTGMRGNVVANNAAIDINNGATLEGRALSTTGAVTVNGVTIQTPIGCGSPYLTGPAAPGLGTAACYGVFSAGGSVTNSGVTYVLGDVGTNNGFTTGYDPMNVSGTIHPVPDISTDSSAEDLLSAYNYLNTLPHDIELLYPADLGNNLVLTPHTYLLNAATVLTDILTLDAQGNPNAVFVILVNGAFSTSTYATVELINGAQAKNVFWKIQGALALNDHSNLKGTFVVNNGAIAIATGAVLEGRALSINGTITTAAAEAGLTNGCLLLPVTWLYFRGRTDVKDVVLEWGTTREVDNGFFTLERSDDGINFHVLTTVTAYRSDESFENAYTFRDGAPYSTGYYRISQTDLNGDRNFFKTVKISTSGSNMRIQHWVNEQFINVRVSSAGKNYSGSVRLYNTSGQLLHAEYVSIGKETSAINIAKPQVPGLYIVQLEIPGETVYSGKVIIH